MGSRTAAIADVSVAHRIVSPEFPEFWARIDKLEGQPSGRWHVAGKSVCQYCALDVETASAEWLKGNPQYSERLARLVRVNVWEVHLGTDELIVDLTDPECRELFHISEAELVGDHSRTQALARELIAMDATGVLAPSPARPGGTNLSLFGPRNLIPRGLRKSTLGESEHSFTYAMLSAEYNRLQLPEADD